MRKPFVYCIRLSSHFENLRKDDPPICPSKISSYLSIRIYLFGFHSFIARKKRESQIVPCLYVWVSERIPIERQRLLSNLIPCSQSTTRSFSETATLMCRSYRDDFKPRTRSRQRSYDLFHNCSCDKTIISALNHYHHVFHPFPPSRQRRRYLTPPKSQAQRTKR